MALTLAQLVEDRSLGLTVQAAEDRLDGEVRWVHVSELDDPAEYMEGGELLLTTGLGIPAPARGEQQRMTAYVRRLVDAGVTGLGFGVGVVHRSVPASMRRACLEAGLPLLAVPRAVPFLAISKAVASAIAREQYETLAAAYDAQHVLTRAALDPDGAAAVVTTLARLIKGWAVLTDPGGRPVHAQPAGARQRAPEVSGELARLRGHGPRSSAALADGGREIVIQGLGAGGRLRGFLVAGHEGRLSAVDRTVVTLAVPLLALALERSRQVATAERALRAAVLELALSDRAGAVNDSVRHTAALLVGDAVDGPWQVAAVGLAQGEPGEDLIAALEDALPPALLRLDEHRILIALPAGVALPGGREPPGRRNDARRGEVLGAQRGEAPGAQLGAQRGEAPGAQLGAQRGEGAGAEGLRALVLRRPDLVVGVSAVRPLGELSLAADQASRALAVARRDDRRMLAFAEIAKGGLVALLADDAVRAYADALLAPLAEYGAQARGSLVESLRVWLAHNGQWDTAASELGVHRHTLRYRMGRVERLLGRPLNDAGTRMELWLALSTTRP